MSPEKKDAATAASSGPERTADGHHIVVNGRTWRATDPCIPEKFREELVRELMSARGAVKSKDEHARERVQDAKVALGERGPVWWKDGAPDLNRHLARTGPYALWYADLEEGER